MIEHFAVRSTFNSARPFNGKALYNIHDGYMADSQQAFNFTVADPFHIKLKRPDHKISTDLLSQFIYGEIIPARFAGIALLAVNNTTLDDMLGFTFRTMGNAFQSGYLTVANIY